MPHAVAYACLTHISAIWRWTCWPFDHQRYLAIRCLPYEQITNSDLGPASLNYDIDMGPISVTDWYYPTAFQIEAASSQALQQASPGPAGDNILINGKNKNTINNGGSYGQFRFTPGKKHLLRLVNTAMDNAIRVSIDGHKMQVITSDLVPIKPITVDSVMLSPAQRYNVIVTADQNTANYWMRATVENACSAANSGVGKAIIRYAGATSDEPTTTTTATIVGCNEPGTLAPWVKNTVGNVDLLKQQVRNLDVNIQLPGTTTNNQNIVVWGVNMSAIDIQWDTPTTTYVMTGNTSYPETYNLIELPNEGIWTYWILQEVEGGPVSIPHPIHLHGHDFYLLGTGSGTINLQTDPDNLQYSNPPRRDTSYLPAGGWMVIAFPTDNPGAWLLHCHVSLSLSSVVDVANVFSRSRGTSLKALGYSFSRQRTRSRIPE